MNYLDRIESWRPVPGWEGWYDASDLGRVRSLDRIITERATGRNRRTRGRILAPSQWGAYLYVDLKRPGRRLTIAVHLVVLRTFAGEPGPGQEALHGRGGQLDNRWPENLAWGTHAKNMGADRARDGTNCQGEQHWNAKLTAAIVLDARRRRAAGEQIKALAREYEVSMATMSEAVNGRTWQHVPAA